MREFVPAVELLGQRRRLLVPVSLLLTGVVVAVVSVWFTARSSVLVYPASDAAIAASTIVVFVGVGGYMWYRMHDGRLGLLLAAYGLFYVLVTVRVASGSTLHTIGDVIWAAWIVLTFYVFLSFPRGQLESGLERRFFAAVAVSFAVVWVLLLLLVEQLPGGGNASGCGGKCPTNAFQLVQSSHDVTSALGVAYTTVQTIAFLGLAMLVVVKARSNSQLRRRMIEPFSYAVVAFVLAFILAVLLVGPAYPESAYWFRAVNVVTFFAIPLAMLVGLARARNVAAASAGRMVRSASAAGVNPSSVQQLLRDALDDPSLTLVRLSGTGKYVDADDRPLDTSTLDERRARIVLGNNGAPVSAVFFDPLVDVDTAAVEGLAATAQMLLENARLAEEVRASRGRLIELSERERRRLERDLHDGAQQGLVALQVRLNILLEQTDDSERATELTKISELADAALGAVRDLAHGIYPNDIQERGIPAALASAASHSSLQIQIVDEGLGRCDPAVELAIYFCISEALQNVAKHAGPAAQVTVCLARHGDAAVFRVVDTGVGFDKRRHPSGTGLLGMRDRIEALGGHLRIESLPGGGTTIEAVVPRSSPPPQQAPTG